uniref:Uncharacterized protein n=1 Tax=Sphaerodactylus townsendi TaxID=933632 RepID=A0ACB8FXT3_9SAUR
MGKAAASSSSCSGSTRGLVSLLSAVPCLACKQPPPSRAAMSLSAASSEGPLPVAGPGSDTYKGWLFKWTNYLKGYQRRWFVLSNGLLSYYSWRP